MTIFARMIQALILVQDKKTGLWYQILDRGEDEGSYVESSASCMFVYALAKGIRNGYLASHCLEAAEKGYAGIIKLLVEMDDSGQANLISSSHTADFKGKQQRDSLYEYYAGKPMVTNDPIGVGAFLMAGVEMKRIGSPA